MINRQLHSVLLQFWNNYTCKIAIGTIVVIALEHACCFLLDLVTHYCESWWNQKRWPKYFLCHSVLQPGSYASSIQHSYIDLDPFFKSGMHMPGFYIIWRLKIFLGYPYPMKIQHMKYLQQYLSCWNEQMTFLPTTVSKIDQW